MTISKRIGLFLGALVLVLAAALLGSPCAHAQGIFLEKGQSGFGATGGVASNDDATGLSIGAGYSHIALIDVGGVISRYSYDKTGWLDLSATGLRGYVNVHLSLLGATATYEKLLFSTGAPAGYDVHFSGWNMFVGGFGHLPLELGGAFGAVPQVTVGIEHASVKMDVPAFYDYYTYASHSSTSLLVRLDGNFTMKDSARLWSLDPMLAVDANNVTFGLFVGGVFH